MNRSEYLLFTKKERKGIIALILIVLTVIFIPGYFFPAEKVIVNIDPNDFDKIKPERYAQKPLGHYDSNFYNKDYDQKRVKAQRYHLFPSSHTYPARDPVRKQKVIEINSADTSDFIALPGIGSKLAARIVLFREKLGGFYRADQLSEVYGLKDSVFRLISPNLRCDSNLVRKLDINTADQSILKEHPYIRWNIANALVSYRSAHGEFKSIEDLEKVGSINNEMLMKIIPYLKFN